MIRASTLLTVLVGCVPSALSGEKEPGMPLEAAGATKPAMVAVAKSPSAPSDLISPFEPAPLRDMEIPKAIPVPPTLIYDAVVANDAELLEKLLLDGQAADEVTEVGDTPLTAAVRLDRDDLAALLVCHGADPNAPGFGGQRPLALASLKRRTELLKVLLEAGAEPERAFASPVSGDLLAPLSKSLQRRLSKERNMTPLMVAVARGDVEAVELLLKHGARAQAHTKPGYLYPISFAAEQGHLFIMRRLLGRNPDSEPQLLVTVDLSDQTARVERDGQELLRSYVSTGRRGYETPEGRYVITDKHKSWTSTIYKASMPYFMRLNCGAIGLHSGYVSGRPASHGCIRLPHQVARKIFGIAKVGDEVVIQR